MILALHDVSIAFGAKVALDGVSFQVEPGEAVALMGPNGAGKTTVLRCILGLLQYRGRIEVAGKDARRQGVEARRHIGYVPQSPAFYDMTAREALRFVARLRGERGVDAGKILERVGLAADADRGVRTFSGGMQQRLSLAAALIGDPGIILLDEPTANLDADARRQLLSLLAEFRVAGKSLVLSSHRPHEVTGLVHRVILLRDGRVERTGPPGEVLPSGRVVVTVHHLEAGERQGLADLLAAHEGVSLAPSNGHLEAALPSRRVVEALERLRATGVARERISIKPLDEGGLA